MSGRPGWGTRHPALAEVLGRASGVATYEDAWGNGTLPLRMTAYLGVEELPDEVVTSVRCLVRVAEKFVVCTNTDGVSHPWPGGRRQPGESFEQTAAREVEEETGWLLEPGSFRLLGWVHLEHLRPLPSDHPWPHPDFCQVVGTAEATERVGGVDADWTDVEGYEASSQLMTLEQADRATDGDPLARVFLRRLSDHSS